MMMRGRGEMGEKEKERESEEWVGREMVFEDESESTHPNESPRTTRQRQTVNTSKIEKQSKENERRKTKTTKTNQRSDLLHPKPSRAKPRDSRKYRSTCRASMMTELRDASGASWVHGPVVTSVRRRDARKTAKRKKRKERIARIARKSGSAKKRCPLFSFWFGRSKRR
jgi:hypothetical protein